MTGQTLRKKNAQMLSFFSWLTEPFLAVALTSREEFTLQMF